VFIFVLATVSYSVFVRSRISSPDIGEIVHVQSSSCLSPDFTEIKNNDEDKENINNTVNSVFVEEYDIKEKVSLQKIVADYFTVENPSSIMISQQTKTHAQGEFGQNWWLAYNDEDSGWKIIASGCSYINCNEISEYDFPSEMAPVCWDTSNNQLIDR